MRQKLLSEATAFLVKNRRRRMWTKVVSCMAAVVVFCTTYVLILPALTLEKDTVCGYEEHVHTDACYLKGNKDVSDGSNTQVVTGGDVSAGDEGTYCGKHSHKHTTACFGDSDTTADVETEEDWEASFADVTMTGNWAQDVVAIAQSQVGYKESENNFFYDAEEKKLNGYTRYGAWYGDTYGDWNAMFVAFCLDYAQVTDFPVDVNYAEWIADLADTNTEDYTIYNQSGSYSPSSGDLAFFDLTQDGTADYVGIVVEVYATDNAEPAQIKVVEGDSEDKVQISTYALESTLIVGYADMVTAQNQYVASRNKLYADGIKAVSVAATDLGAASIFEYEDENMAITLYVEGNIDFNEVSGGNAIASGGNTSVSQEDLWKVVRCKFEPLDDYGDEYYELAEYALENNGTDELYDLKAYRFAFYYRDIELDIDTLSVSAEIIPNAVMLTAPEMALMTLALEDDVEEKEEIIAPEAEVGTVISVLGKTGSEITGLNSALVKSGETVSALAVPLSGNIVALAASNTANPNFTVQYYAYIDTATTSGSEEKELTVINTNNGGKGTGGNLPKNGSLDLATKNVYLNSENELATSLKLTKVYSQKSYQYVAAPNLRYFNRISENGNYQLSQVWVLISGKKATSTAESDWDIYSASDIHFTNREQSANDTTILIKDDTVIRLVYKTTEGTYKNSATFYDYDITNGNFYKSNSTNAEKYTKQGNGVTYAYTSEQGINSSGNYANSKSETKLAFGNCNTGTGLGNVSWNGNYLNRYNANAIKDDDGTFSEFGTLLGYYGCTFGIAERLDNKGQIVYSSGISVPKLFNEGDATGKTKYSQYSLNFERVGDTYTLTSVGGTQTKNLDKFSHPGSYSIWTNNFWPMDYVESYGTSGHDLKFGDTSKYNDRKYFGKTSGPFSSEGKFPKSDDSLDHNSYFGMQYAVKFNLSEDYEGPLEYYFFGDDDMWVFLSPADDNGNLTGTGKLVCDIGGVHSSVGQYVNLWDYIEKGSSGNYVLSFFYTERGASGSTCYMRFSLPSVSSVTPAHDTGNLRVEKSVEGVSTEKEFEFEIKLTDANGAELKDDYSYTRYDSNGDVIKNDLIVYNGGSFKLKDGEYIIINYLPNGTKYTIKENVPNGFHASTKGSSGIIIPGNEATGTIVTDKMDVVQYINTASYALPNTGGCNTQLYAMAGLVLIFSAAYLLYRQKKCAWRTH